MIVELDPTLPIVLLNLSINNCKMVCRFFATFQNMFSMSNLIDVIRLSRRRNICLDMSTLALNLKQRDSMFNFYCENFNTSLFLTSCYVIRPINVSSNPKRPIRIYA